MFSGLACVLAAAPALAQDDAAPAPAGATAVSLEVGSGYVVGVWRQLSSRTRAGIEAGAILSRTAGDGREQDLVHFTVAPTVKLFSAADGALRPYTLVGAYVEGYGQHLDSDESVAEYSSLNTEAGVRAGVGMEWMPVRRLAVGGHVGVRGGYVRNTTGNQAGDDSDERTATGWSASTFASGISLTLFF